VPSIAGTGAGSAGSAGPPRGAASAPGKSPAPSVAGGGATLCGEISGALDGATGFVNARRTFL